MHANRLWGIATTAMVLVMVLSACAREPAGETAVVPEGEEGAVENVVTAMPEELEEERILRVALPSVLGAGVLDPLVLASDIAIETLLGPAFDNLLVLDLDGRSVPGLATNWHSNEDATVWTIELRQGVQFHDGWGEMTAEDVKFTLERYYGPEATSSTAVVLQDTVDEIVVRDRYTVEIHLNRPYPEFMSSIFRESSAAGMIMSRAYYDAVGEETFIAHPIGTGRWKFVEFLPGDSITYDAVDEHWTGVLPGFDRLILMEIPEEGARIAMLGNGDADLIEVSIDTAVLLERMGYYEIPIVPGTAVVHLQFWGNWYPEAIEANMPTTHREVREALSLAINRQEIVDTLYDGMLDPRPFPGMYTSPIGEGLDIERWREWAQEAQRYDPERARELLREAGFPDGFEISIWSYEWARFPQPELVEVIASYWEQIGVTVNIVPTDYYGYYRPLWRLEEQDPIIFGTVGMHTADTFPAPADQTARTYGPASTWRLLDPTNEEWMELATRVTTELDPDLRAGYFNELLSIVGEEYINPVVLWSSTAYAVSDRVGEWATIPGVGIASRWVYLFQPAE